MSPKEDQILSKCQICGESDTLQPYSMLSAKLFDHTLLRPESTQTDIERLCLQAKDIDACSVCVNSCWVPLCLRLLTGTRIKVCSVVGFPLGAMSTAAKEFETKWAIEQGAQEIDMVMNVGWAKAGAWDEVEAEIAGLARLCGDRATLKVILETCLLNDEEIIRACLAAKRAGAGFVKTSTGFGSAGATEDHIRLMRKMVGDEMGVKASGGIRTREKAEAMVKAGASRIGSSNTLAILGGT